MKRLTLCLLTVLGVLVFLPQYVHSQKREVIISNGEKVVLIDGLPLLSKKDSLAHISLPELILPESYRSKELPEVVDNSALPYFRPIFNQTSLDCGQASAIASRG